jgi:hypothetical protein
MLRVFFPEYANNGALFYLHKKFTQYKMLMSLNVSNVALSKQIDVKSEVSVNLEVDGVYQMNTSGILLPIQHVNNSLTKLTSLEETNKTTGTDDKKQWGKFFLAKTSVVPSYRV